MRIPLVVALLVLTGCTSINQWVGEMRSPEVVDDAVADEAPDGPPLLATVDVSINLYGKRRGCPMACEQPLGPTCDGTRD